MDIQKAAYQLKGAIEKEAPTILTVLGASGVLSTGLLTHKAALNAHFILQEDLVRLYDPDKEFREKVKLVWKCYIPPAISGVLTIFCIFSANSVNKQRSAALASLYSLTQLTLDEYQSKIVETIGKRKEEKVRDDIHQDRLLANPIENNEIIVTGRGTYLFYDSLSGRYFLNNMEVIRKAQNDFNEVLMTEMYKVLNDLYSEIGLDPIEMGRNMGWNIDDGLMDIRFVPMIASTGEPCVCLEYSVQPRFL